MYESSDDDEPRVYVDNQNTPTAVVTINASASTFRREWTHRMRSNRTSFCFSRATKAPGDGLSHSSDSARSQSAKTSKTSLSHSPPRPQKLRKSDVHPQLEDVYQRVMRRLQRKANYEEIESLPLAVQFGVVDMDGEGAAQGNCDAAQGNCDAAQSLPGVVPTSGNNSQQQLRESVSVSSGGTVGPRIFSAGAGVRSLAKRKNNASFYRHVGSNTTGDDSAVDDALILAQQPCPGTLRLVIDHVMKIVQGKLSVANGGSLKDCLRFVFESRSLLDRLLKEIPSYSHFQGEGDRLPSTAQMQQIYQEFRNAPVVLPSAQYAMDPVNGKVSACINETATEVKSPSARAPRNAQQSTTAPPPSTHSQQSAVAMSLSSSGVAMPATLATTRTSHSGSTATRLGLVEVPSAVTLPSGASVALPATYGVSTRRARGSSGGPAGRLQSVTSQFAPAAPSFSSSFASHFQGETQTTRSTEGDNVKVVSTPGTAVDTVERSSKRSGHMFAGKKAAPLSEQRCRATQVVSVGTLTDINDTTIVSRDAYESLQAAKEEVEVECAELRKRVEEIRAQLEEEKLYTSRKQKVVQYLRETLYKECCVLRSQLSQAQMKDVQLQSQLRDARDVQGQSIMAKPLSDAGRSTAVSMEASTRFPSVGIAARRQQSENSILGLGTPQRRPTPTLYGSRRRDPSGVGEDREEAFSASANGMVRTVLSVDITAIHSLLDLVLLAVERNEVLPNGASKERKLNIDLSPGDLESEPDAVQREVVNEFLARQRHMKETFKTNRVHMSNLIASKDQQIRALKYSSNTIFFKHFWTGKSDQLRSDLRHLRRDVQEALMGMKLVIISTQSALTNRCSVAEVAMQENHALSASQTALRDIISSACALFTPMMTTEYTRGYHPWPLRLRNSIDPLTRMIQSRYGQGQLVGVREELDMISCIYTDLHHFVMSRHVEPNIKRPATGVVLRSLCASLVLNATSQTDLYLQVRERYQSDLHYGKLIAQLNTAIMSFIYRQRIVSERSVMALREVGMDPMLTSMPVQMTINKLAEEVRRLSTERTLLRKQRMDNAREVYRLWKNKQIDIYEGYAPPSVAQRLVFLEEAKNRRTHFSVAVSQNPLEARSSTSLSAQSLRPDVQGTSYWDSMLSVSGETQAESPFFDTASTASNVSNARRIPSALSTQRIPLESEPSVSPSKESLVLSEGASEAPNQ